MYTCTDVILLIVLPTQSFSHVLDQCMYMYYHLLTLLVLIPAYLIYMSIDNIEWMPSVFVAVVCSPVVDSENDKTVAIFVVSVYFPPGQSPVFMVE